MIEFALLADVKKSSPWSQGRRNIIQEGETYDVRTLYLLYKEKMFVKKNQNAPRPSEHPPVRGERMSFEEKYQRI